MADISAWEIRANTLQLLTEKIQTNNGNARPISDIFTE
jgi:hypothetical protein